MFVDCIIKAVYYHSFFDIEMEAWLLRTIVSFATKNNAVEITKNRRDENDNPKNENQRLRFTKGYKG